MVDRGLCSLCSGIPTSHIIVRVECWRSPGKKDRRLESHHAGSIESSVTYRTKNRDDFRLLKEIPVCEREVNHCRVDVLENVVHTLLISRTYDIRHISILRIHWLCEDRNSHHLTVSRAATEDFEEVVVIPRSQSIRITLKSLLKSRVCLLIDHVPGSLADVVLEEKVTVIDSLIVTCID